MPSKWCVGFGRKISISCKDKKRLVELADSKDRHGSPRIYRCMYDR